MSERLVPEISVAISTRDRASSLGRCLESLRTGELVPAEVVVADQSERTGTRETVEEADSTRMRVRYVRGRPGGLAVAQNDAVRHTTQPLVAVLDDDCIADPGWLAALVKAFDLDDAYGFIAGRVLPLGRDRPGAYAISSRVSTMPREFSGKSVPWHVGSGNNFALRREWFDRIGGCDERLGPGSPGQGGVDMDLFYRLLRAGARARYEPDALVLHERTTRRGRLARRSPYGHGMGACVTLWLREGDRFAWRVLSEWLGMRGRLLARALARGHWLSAYEELLVLKGTALGLVHGIRVADRRPLPR